LSEKKLVILDLDEKISEEKQEFLIKILDKIPDNNIILFNAINPDKRTKFYKELKKQAELKKFNTKDDSDLHSIISSKYPNKITFS
jgi:Mg/Co/Ni transporter MgtE